MFFLRGKRQGCVERTGVASARNSKAHINNRSARERPDWLDPNDEVPF
jgi:hypothetical protein